MARRPKPLAAVCLLTLSLSVGAAPACRWFWDDVDCQDSSVQPGEPCSRKGAVCQWADDCGGQVLECSGGRWLTTSGTGCFADPVKCKDGPVEGDNCEPAAACDPDGDCRDVLECEWGEWTARAVCSPEYCSRAAPEQGKPCDEPGRPCNVEHPCGGRRYVCGRAGRWDFDDGVRCADPVPCDRAPVRGDACETKGDVCSPPVADLPSLVCDGSSWNVEEST